MDPITAIEVAAALMPPVAALAIKAGLAFSMKKTDVLEVQEKDGGTLSFGPFALRKKTRTEKAKFETDMPRFLLTLGAAGVATLINTLSGTFLVANVAYALVLGLASQPDMLFRAGVATACSAAWAAGTKTLVDPVLRRMFEAAGVIGEALEELKNGEQTADGGNRGEADGNG